MIGTLDISCSAKNPNLPLHPLRAYLNSPSSLRINNVPKKIGQWSITSVQLVAAYPDNSVKTAQCVLVGGVWVGTIAGSTLTGTSENGYTVYANGVDENGDEVDGYILGKGDVEILDTDGTLSPTTPTSYVHMLSAQPEDPKEGDLFPLSGEYYIWQNGSAHALGGVPSSIKDASGNVIDANRAVKYPADEPTWTVSRPYYGTFTLSPSNSWFNASYEPADPQEGDYKIELEITEGSSWATEHLYDINIYVYRWEWADEEYKWVSDSGGDAGQIAPNQTTWSLFWTCVYSNPVVNDQLALKSYVDEQIGDIGTLLDILNGEVI